MAIERDRLFQVLALLVFTDTFGYAIVLPLMPLAAQRRGASVLAVGALFATYSGCQLVFAPILGRLSDRFGLRNRFSLPARSGSAAGFALMLLGGYIPLLVSRVVDGVTAGNIAIVNAIVLDRFPRSEWGARFTALSTATGLGILVGIGVSAGLARFGLSAAALVALALCAAAAAFLWWFLPETAKGDRVTQPWTIRLVGIQRAVPAGFVATALQAAFLLTFPLYLNRLLGWQEVQSTLALAGLIGLAAAFQLAVVRRLMSRLDARSVAMLGFGLVLAGGIVLFVFHTAAVVLAGASAAILGVALLGPAVPTLISLHNRSLKEGAVMGVNQSVASAGQMAGPVLGYGALQLLATPGYGAICAALAVGGIALTYPIRRGASDE